MKKKLMRGFGIRDCAVPNVDGFTTFRQNFQLPSSGLMALDVISALI
jgi:hypothetical protein